MWAMQIFFSYFNSPTGRLRLRATDVGLIAVDHENQQESTQSEWLVNTEHSILNQASRELAEYFLGSRQTFSTPLVPDGTAFQHPVWSEFSKIPFGGIVSYSTIAERINNPKAVRAVGAANGRNPLSIFVPCHRVTGKNGTLTGYAGGLSNKQFLLEFESRFAPMNHLL